MYSRTTPTRRSARGLSARVGSRSVKLEYGTSDTIARGNALCMSRGSKNPRSESRSASSTSEVSRTLRQTIPARSRYGSAPIEPPYGIRPLVVTSATAPLRHAGCRHDPPVSSQIEHVTRLPPTDEAEPELDPPVSNELS